MATADYFLLIIHSKIIILADTESRDHPMGIWLDFFAFSFFISFSYEKNNREKEKRDEREIKNKKDDFDHQS